MINESNYSVAGVSLRIKWRNDKPARPTLVFLHESFGCIKHWKDFPERLAEATDCNILVYDRQGYGASEPFATDKRENDYLEKEAVVLNELLQQFKIENVILFGHSDGGSIALIAAAKFPEKIKAVITEGAHVFVETITRIGIENAVEVYEKGELREKLRYYHGEKTDLVFRLWAETWLSEAFGNWNIEHCLPEITCPVLAIQGKKDEYGSIRQIESIIGNVSGNAFRFLPDAGHTPHRETQEETIKEVAKFIKNLLF